MICLGDNIISFLSQARHNVLIVAPFIRSEALSRMLDSIQVNVEIKIVTRWRPADLIAGASDLDVFDIATNREIPLYLRNDLHAKLFAADKYCLVGSANVTSAALGWNAPANFELLVSISRSDDSIVTFEENLFESSVLATSELCSQLRELIAQIGERKKGEYKITQEESVGLLPPNWIPQSRAPEDLFKVYRNQVEHVNQISMETMRNELIAFGVDSGLDEQQFNSWIASVIKQTPIVIRVLECIQSNDGITENEFSDILYSVGGSAQSNEVQDLLDTLKRWLTHFLRIPLEMTIQEAKLIKAKKV